MATPCSLISKIHSHFQPLIDRFDLKPRLKIVLRHLTVDLVCLRNLGEADKHAMQSLFSRLEVAIDRASASHDYEAVLENVLAVIYLAKEVNDECEWRTNAISDRLTLDDVVEVAGSLLDSTADFWAVARFRMEVIPNPANLRYAMDEFEVQIRFLRDFLLFAKRSAVETQQLQSLLIHLRPFVLKAARVYDGTSSRIDDSNWVEEVRSKCPLVDPQVFSSYAQTLMSMSMFNPTDDADAVLKAFLSSLISLLWHILRYHSDSLKPLYECLRLSRFNLKRNNNSDFEAQIGALIRDAGIMICSVYLAGVDSESLSDLLQRFDLVQTQVLLVSNSLRESVWDSGDSTTKEEVSERKVQTNAAMASTRSSSIPRVVGFQDDVSLIEDRIVRGSKQLRLVPISGMAGLGKTTFALEIYNLRSVMYHFQARAWCTISQVFDKKKVLLQLLNQIHPGVYTELTEDDLANKFRQSLKGKRYLILLDDVWTPQVWENLGPSFPDDATQSRVVFTSRLHAIVPLALPDEKPHFLRLRTEIECLKIIEMKLLNKAGDLSTVLRKFAKMCKGLPLTAVLIAGLLSTTSREGWDGILEHFRSSGISRMEQCKISLELSYKQLPECLKPCFIYFGTFPEDEEICVRKLISLWIAEGFVAERIDLLKKKIQDVAQEYLDELIQRNLVMVAGKKSIGGIKYCRIHDLLHNFCVVRGKRENLFHRLQQTSDGISDFNEPCNLVRLSIHSTAHHFIESKLFCPLAHSLLHFTSDDRECELCDMVFIIQIYKHLRVLDLEFILFSAGVPSDIGLLTRLTYLSISTRVPVIPSSIGNLSNLETLIVKITAFVPVSLPRTICELQNLKCLYITMSIHLIKYGGFCFPIEDLEYYPNLLEVESVCGVQLLSNGCMENSTRKFPNIRKLKCHVRGGESSEELNKIVVPEFLSQLEFLTLCAEDAIQCRLDFGSTATNLRKVTLKTFMLSREEIAIMGKMPKLEALKLEDIVFLGGSLEMEEGEFLKLRVLKLVCFYLTGNLEKWTIAGDDTLPCLEKLVFRFLKDLKEIPCSCLEDSSTLEEIEVTYCSSALDSLVRNIEVVQNDFGNSIRVQIYSGSKEAYKKDGE